MNMNGGRGPIVLMESSVQKHQVCPVGLELGDVDVEGAAEGGGQGGDDQGDGAVEAGVGRGRSIVEHDGDVGVLEEGVGEEHGVVWLGGCGGDLLRGDG
jgi:hypothetical protein